MDSEQISSVRLILGSWGSALGLTSRYSIQTVLLVLFVLCFFSNAQQPSVRPYESEEDLWEALSEGELTFDEFVELLDLARAGDDSLLVPRSDWEALPGSEVGYLGTPDSTKSLINIPSPTSARLDIPWMSAIRIGVVADLSDPTGSDGYSVVRFQQGDWRGVLDFEHERDDGGTWRRRSLVWRPEKYAVVLGNFEPRWGRGLVVGRRSRVIQTADRAGSLLQPTLGRLDGVFAGANFGSFISAESFVSYQDSDELREFGTGLSLVGTFNNLQVGVSGAASINGLSEEVGKSVVFRDSYSSRALGASVRMLFGDRTVLSEFAVGDRNSTAKAAEVVWPLSTGRFHARVWSYGTGYINPLGGGPGHSDTREVELADTERSFKSRISGERGFDFTTRMAVSPSMNLRWDWMSHREEPGTNLEHSGVFRAEFEQTTFRTTPFVRARVDEAETESYSIGNYLWWGPDNRELNLRLEFGTHYADEVQFIRVGIGAKLQLNRIVRLAPALRWVDPRLDTPSDGYWYFYFTETVLPVAGARVEMALVWKKYEAGEDDDLVELRVRGFIK